MASGVPVVISDQVNIWPEVSRAKAGLVVPCAVSATAQALRQLLDDPPRPGKWDATGAPGWPSICLGMSSGANDPRLRGNCSELRKAISVSRRSGGLRVESGRSGAMVRCGLRQAPVAARDQLRLLLTLLIVPISRWPPWYTVRKCWSRQGIEFNHVLAFTVGFLFYWICPVALGVWRFFDEMPAMSVWYGILTVSGMRNWPHIFRFVAGLPVLCVRTERGPKAAAPGRRDQAGNVSSISG